MYLGNDLKKTIFDIFFWMSWLTIPFLIEVIPKLYVEFIVLKDYLLKKFNFDEIGKLKEFPFITVIIPVYNSSPTLWECLRSINSSTYPDEQIQIIVADNESGDGLRETFFKIQKHFPNLMMQYVNTQKGKASALNAAIYRSVGSYIINIDSDGRLDSRALEKIVKDLEDHPDLAATGGTVLTDQKQIKGRSFFKTTEFFEYCQIFFFGRKYAARSNELFTMSGAFAAYRRDALLQTEMYNTGSIAEDTDLTFQVRSDLESKVGYCRDAIFYTDPIDGFESLYRQRERWQRGELEVVNNFSKLNFKIKNFFNNFIVRQLVFDNTFAFMEVIWLFSSIMLISMHLSATIVIVSYILLYLVYIILALLYWIGCLIIMPSQSKNRQFLKANWQVIFTYPAYSFITFWIRLIGIIDFFTKTTKWNDQELKTFFKRIQRIIKSDFEALTERVIRWWQH